MYVYIYIIIEKTNLDILFWGERLDEHEVAKLKLHKSLSTDSCIDTPKNCDETSSNSRVWLKSALHS